VSKSNFLAAIGSGLAFASVWRRIYAFSMRKLADIALTALVTIAVVCGFMSPASAAALSGVDYSSPG